ncbi:type II secretion system protein, partial [Candidatus Saccharibacteria bacterium]|nr:type II secretion system protein [Candidatus Saccharibacteria bacterium]
MDDVNDRRLAARAETGFTIVETVIAIAIFSFLIIFCLGMFIFVGRIYYRGLYEGQTQEVARSIVDNVSEGLRSSGGDVFEYLPASPNPQGWRAYCIGGFQYSFRENIQLITEGSPGDRQAAAVFIVSDVCNPTDPANPIPTPPADCNR